MAVKSGHGYGAEELPKPSAGQTNKEDRTWPTVLIERPRMPQETLFDLTAPSRVDGYPTPLRSHLEHQAKERGMELAAEAGRPFLEQFRLYADTLWLRYHRPISIEDVRLEAAIQGYVYTSGNWQGSVFTKRDGWVRHGWVKTTHEGGHARQVQTWVKP